MYQIFGWEDEDEGREGVHYLTIADGDGEEIAVIIHRICDGKYPLDGELAMAKFANAQHIVKALNAYEVIVKALNAYEVNEGIL